MRLKSIGLPDRVTGTKLRDALGTTQICRGFEKLSHYNYES